MKNPMMCRNLTGYIVYELMRMWDGQPFPVRLCMDLGVLRKWFLIEVLKCYFNESADNISEDIRAVVYSIRNMDIEKYF